MTPVPVPVLISSPFYSGYIDLSKRRVSPEDIVKAEEKYNKSKAVHSIMRHVSETCKVKVEELYQMVSTDVAGAACPHIVYSHHDALLILVRSRSVCS